MLPHKTGNGSKRNKVNSSLSSILFPLCFVAWIQSTNLWSRHTVNCTFKVSCLRKILTFQYCTIKHIYVIYENFANWFTMPCRNHETRGMGFRVHKSYPIIPIANHFTKAQWGSPSASDPRAKNTGKRATKGTVLTPQSLSPWCDCRCLGSTLASWHWQDINVGNPLWLRALLQNHCNLPHLI